MLTLLGTTHCNHFGMELLFKRTDPFRFRRFFVVIAQFSYNVHKGRRKRFPWIRFLIFIGINSPFLNSIAIMMACVRGTIQGTDV